MVTAHDVHLDDGRLVRAYDSADTAPAGAFTIVCHHGTPQTGALLDPLLAAASERGIRLVSYGRPSYGGSTPRPGRNIALAAADVAAVADSLGLDRFAVMGASGGCPHALACAALLPDRVSGVAALAGLAPYGAEGLDYFAGIVGDAAALRAALKGRDARATFEETAEFDPASFIDRDYAALDGNWSSLGADVGRAAGAGSDGVIDDDVAYVTPWGFQVEDISAPVLLVHGGQDRVNPPAHSDWLLRHLPDPELWLRPHDGHISILDTAPLAMDWLKAHRRPTR